MSIKYKKVTEEKFKELAKRVRQQLHETLVAAIMALDRKEVMVVTNMNVLDLF